MIKREELKTKLYYAIKNLSNIETGEVSLLCIVALLLYKWTSYLSLYPSALSAESKFSIPHELCWSFLKESDLSWNEVLKLLNDKLEGIRKAKPDLWELLSALEITQLIETNSPVKGTAAKEIISSFSTLDFSNTNDGEMVSEEIDNIISHAASPTTKSIGLHYTPRGLRKLLVYLLKPQENQSIYDPTCGIGGFLETSASYVRSNGGEASKLYFYGQEIDKYYWALSRAKLLFSSINNFDIRLGNTLLEPKFLQEDQLQQFDIVISNPPYGIKVWNNINLSSKTVKKLYPYGEPPKSSADYAFLQHILGSIKKNGRAAVLVAHGTLFRSGKEGSIRSIIIEEDLIEAVIGLPSNLMLNTSIPLAIVIFNKSKEIRRKESILFIDASFLFVKDGKLKTFSDKNIAEIVSAFDSYANEKGFSSVISIKEIRRSYYNLNIAQYVQSINTHASTSYTSELQKVLALHDAEKRTWGEFNFHLMELGFEPFPMDNVQD